MIEKLPPSLSGLLTKSKHILLTASQWAEPYIRRFLRWMWQIIASRQMGIIAGGLLLCFVTLNYVVLPWYVYHGGTLSVPNVVGLPFEDASRVLSEAGLVPREGDKILDNSFPIGSVVVQNPKPNAIVKYGRHVYLTVCGGEVSVNVPSLRGRSLRDARFALERNGLTLGDIQYIPSDSSPENTIVSQALTAGDKVKKGTPVGVVVSTGRLAKSVEVPNLFGKSLAEAARILARSGLRMGNITYQVNIELLPNTVVDQFPLAGSAVDSGKTIDLFVVKAGKLQDEI